MCDSKKCPNCGGGEFKKGKLHGIAGVQPLESRTGLGGSELLLTFCAACGQVVALQVKDPDKV